MNARCLNFAERRTALGSLMRFVAVLPLLLLLVGGQFAGGAHHHEAPGSSDSCPVCVHAGTPAVGAAGLPSMPAPGATAQRPHLAPALAPRTLAPRLAPSRAPPLA